MLKLLSTQRSHRGLLNGIHTITDKDVAIRLGSQDGNDNDYDIVINPKIAIQKCINKITMKQLINRVTTHTPKIFTNDNQIINHSPIKLVIKTQNHSRGRGIKLFNFECANDNYDDVEELLHILAHNVSIEKYIECRTEYRFHIIGHKLIHIDVKKDGEGWVKNRQNGYRFVSVDESKYNKRLFQNILRECNKVMDIISLDIGAFDVGYDGENFWIFEVNSAPGLKREIIYNKYKNAIKDLIQSKL